MATSGVIPSDLDERHNPIHQHSQRRFFIGPMPEKVISDTAEVQLGKKKKGRWFHSNTEEEEEEVVSRTIKNHAFTFFLSEGGNIEDWGEEQERGITARLMQEWEGSDWGKILRRHKEAPPRRNSNRWVGSSFEVGSLLGVNLINQSHRDSESIRDAASSYKSTSPNSSPTRTRTRAQPTSPNNENDIAILLFPPPGDNGADTGGIRLGEAPSPTSSTVLLRPGTSKVRSEVNIRPALRKPSAPRSDTLLDDPTFDIANGGKQKGKTVHYSDEPSARMEPDPPAPPSEVLNRTGDAVHDTSAGASLPPTRDESQWGEVVLRGLRSLKFP